MLGNAIYWRRGDLLIRKDKIKRKDGSVKTYVRVVESYRPGPGSKPKQRTIRSFGYLEDQPDPAEFLRTVEAFDADPANRKQVCSQRMYSGSNRTLNYGYRFLESIYEGLQIPQCIGTFLRDTGFRGTYDVQEVFKYLVFSRILAPASKRASLQRQQAFYGWDLQLELPHVYRSLDQIAAVGPRLQQHLHERIRSTVGRDLRYAYYDLTNYFFEIDEADPDGELRRKGVSKEHRVDPIVQMGLFLDSRGLPVAMSLFPGNTSETSTLQPMMQDLKKAYGLERLIVVADKGINSSKNIDYICAQGDGYVLSQVLRGSRGKRYLEAMEEENGYVWNTQGTCKHKLFTESYTGLDRSNRQETRQRQVLICWSQAEARRAARKRQEKLALAARARHNGAYGIRRGVQEYTKEILVERETGEIRTDLWRVGTVDHEKAERDARFDGFSCLITSEMDYDAAKMREAYSGLWRIEESFRILKSDLLARPVFVSTREHIEAHFLICFTALLILRLIQYALQEGSLSAERIARALNAATCKIRPGGYVELDDVGGSLAFEKKRDRRGRWVDTLSFSAVDEVAEDYRMIQQVFGTEMYEVRVKQESFGRFLNGIRFPFLALHD